LLLCMEPHAVLSSSCSSSCIGHGAAHILQVAKGKSAAAACAFAGF
jgi:hypothetical protein